MTEELKPCPFCRSEAKMGFHKTLADYYVYCSGQNCTCTSGMSTDKEYVIAQWNTRPVEDALNNCIADALAAIDGVPEGNYSAEQMKALLATLRETLEGEGEP